MIRHGVVSLLISVALATGCSNQPAPSSVPNKASEPSSPESRVRNSTEAIQAFVDSGLEAANPRPMTRTDYGAAPLLAVEGTRFQIPSLAKDLDSDGQTNEEEADIGGRVLSFTSQDDLAQSKAYYDDLAKTSAAFFSHTFVKDNLLVQINGDLPDDKAALYEQALQGLAG
jgi:hypothetical protein